MTVGMSSSALSQGHAASLPQGGRITHLVTQGIHQEHCWQGIILRLFRQFCHNPEDDLIVSDPVKDDKDEENGKENLIKAERVEDEKEENKKYLKTSRVCQFFNIC